MGLGINLDWIVSSKLILKLNANVQSTKVDNFYTYKQHSNIKTQMEIATKTTRAAVTELVQGEMRKTGYANDAFNYADFYAFRDQTGWANWTDAQRDDVEKFLLNSYSKNGNADVTVTTPDGGTAVVSNPLSMYYAMRYGDVGRELLRLRRNRDGAAGADQRAQAQGDPKRLWHDRLNIQAHKPAERISLR